MNPLVREVLVCPFYRAEDEPTDYSLMFKTDLVNGTFGFFCSCGNEAPLINEGSQYACMKPGDTSHGCVRRGFAITRFGTDLALRNSIAALMAPVGMPVNWFKEA